MRTTISEKRLRIGNVFTPKKWAEFAIEQFDIFGKWMNGATVFDPTMGTGNLLESLVEFGLKKGYKLENLPVNNLFGNELNTEYFTHTLNRFRQSYGINLSTQITNCDILTLSPRQFDIIFGNPPWKNFNDLPGEYKEKVRSIFDKSGLIRNKQTLLLGGSRMDISALIIQMSINNFLKKRGHAYFFLPLSLLLNDGAHEQFREFKTKDTSFAPVEIFDFKNEPVFHKISTRYGLAHFERDCIPRFPIDYYMLQQNKWTKHLASPIQKHTGPFSIYEKVGKKPLKAFNAIELPKVSMPRQGLNTCGANNVYFFRKVQKISSDICLVEDQFELPSEMIYPLLTSANFKDRNKKPSVWVLIPHNKNGRPLSKQELDNFPSLKKYLEQHREKLTSRRGTLIQSHIKRGLWWALLGVGSYNYAPYKVVWEAYGKKKFNPMLVDGHWQANQSLQAFIPFGTKKEAEKILKKLNSPQVEHYLLSMKMEGTMNWAQPGKIKQLIRFVS
ncbi:MAG: hypothetical protein PWQ17_1810 [Anaerophaga sp.]|nr:hypothetical protein [Anaerophaga sp.]